MKGKIKMRDFEDECVRLGVTKITFDFSGLGLALADGLKQRGVEVTNSRK